MTYQEKKTVTSMITGIPVIAGYFIYAFVKYQAFGTKIAYDLKFWATAMLIFIAAGVVIAIVTQIIFHIGIAVGGEIKRRIVLEAAADLKHKPSVISQNQNLENIDCSEFEVEDEMDKLILLKAQKIGYILAGTGFLIGLITLALNLPPAIMLNTLFLFFGLASLAECFVQLHYYRHGF